MKTTIHTLWILTIALPFAVVAPASASWTPHKTPLMFNAPGDVLSLSEPVTPSADDEEDEADLELDDVLNAEPYTGPNIEALSIEPEFLAFAPLTSTPPDDSEIRTTQVPEPLTLTLLALGFAGLGLSRRKRSSFIPIV